MENIKYLKNGKKVKLIEILYGNDEYLVSDILVYIDQWGDESEEYASDEVYIVKEIFDTPPSIVFAKELDTYNKRREKLKEEIKVQEEFLNQSKKLVLEMKEKLDKFDELKYVLDFIDGKIQYYVTVNYSTVDIVPISEAISDYKKPRLLVLYGDKDIKLEWKLHIYSDGSGGSEWCYPCTSYEEAQSVAQEQLDKLFKEGKHPNLRKILQNNLTIPDGYLEKIRKEQTKSRLESIEKKKLELKKLEQSPLPCETILMEFENALV